MWTFTTDKVGPSPPPPPDICCLTKQKEEAARKEASLELEIEARIRLDHPEYLAYCRVIEDIKKDRDWRSRWASITIDKERDRQAMVMCAESDLLSSLDQMKKQFRQKILDDECKEGLLSTLRK